MTISYDCNIGTSIFLFLITLVILILIALSTSSPHPLLLKNGVTSLMIASYYGQTSVVQALLQGGATINTTTWVRHKLLHGKFQRVGFVCRDNKLYGLCICYCMHPRWTFLHCIQLGLSSISVNVNLALCIRRSMYTGACLLKLSYPSIQSHVQTHISLGRLPSTLQ